MDGEYRIRLATAEDAAVIAEMRRQLHLAVGKADDERMEKVVEAFTRWVGDAMRRDRYVGWVVETGAGVPVANAGLLLLDWPPNSRDINTTRGHILNVWTHPKHRRKGIARSLMERAMTEARRREIFVVTLHSSDDGRGLYEKLGFRVSREMMFVEPGE